ncbi:YtxH domain-containing protein [Peribacillus simplex]|uniref:YtxH domain-containing protein n=1 Tax=Peribacillus simplex TaxID=1478 RepID=UPI000777B82D|nr:YtxH domain-containing protein [Peribacillus simplex]MDM5296436.1 YtxH domain-containing protein [Peribacillus simplex]
MSNIREEYKCAKKSKFMQAVFIGALVGAAVSLFDKNTRYSVLENSKSCLSNMKELVKNPNGVLSQVRETSSKVRSTVEKISDDVSFISQKVEEMKDIPSQVAQVVIETKEVFAAEPEDSTSSQDPQGRVSSN